MPVRLRTLSIGALVFWGCLLVSGPATADEPRMCLATAAGLDPGPCLGAAAELLEPNKPVTLRIDVPTTAAPPSVDVVVVDAGRPEGRRLTLEPVARDGAIVGRRFAKLAGRSAFRRASGDEAGNYRPRWHPEGHALAWHQIGDLARLWCLDLRGATLEARAVEFPDEDADELFGEAADGISHFEWIPGSNSVLVRLTRARRLRRVDFERCRGAVTVADDLPEVTEFSISPDGRWMVWRPVGDERLVVGPVGGEPIGALCGPGADPSLRTSVCRGVRWRPDGGALAFWHAQSGLSGGQQVVSVSLDRRKKVIGQPRPVRVSTQKSAEGSKKKPAMAIAYSPSGEHLAFVSDGRIHVVDARPGGEPAAARALSMSRGRYNSNKSDIVWLDTHHIAAVIDGTGGQHPVVVAHIDPDKAPTILSRAFPSHYDLAWEPVHRRLAVSGFAGQQGIWLADLTAKPPKDAPTPEYFLTVRAGEATPLNLTGQRPRHAFADGLELDGRWELIPGTDAARLTVTFVLRKKP